MSLQQQEGEKTDFERAIEKATGETIEFLRNTPLDELRKRVEKKFGKPMKVVSSGPNLVSHQEVETQLDKALQ